MTNEDFLLKLIKSKDYWQFHVPFFKKQKQLITIKQDSVYYGVFQIHLEVDLLFECLVESVKGIVVPVESRISSYKPVIEYRIDGRKLKKGYIYEDGLVCHYPGGKHTIYFEFMVPEKEIKPISIKPAVPKSTLPEYRDKNMSLKESAEAAAEGAKEASINGINVLLEQRTFNINDPVKIHIENPKGIPKYLVFKCDDELITPSETEVYIKDNWLQEWFIRQSAINRMINSFFIRDPFREIEIEIYVDGEVRPSFTKVLTITEFKPYDTRQIITSDKEYKKVLIQVNRIYVESLIHNTNKKENDYILDLAKACLNYNQKNKELKLFYIWMLLEYGMKKEAVSELNVLKKYSEYFIDSENEMLIEMLEHIVNNEKIDSVDINSFKHEHWIMTLAVARYATSNKKRYNYYKHLYDKGLRKSFLFAEGVSFINKHFISPSKDDQFYVKALQWALNKKAVSSGWLTKLERSYYQLEKNPYFSSTIGKKLYEEKSSKNLLRLYANMLLKEEVATDESFRIIEKGLQEKVLLSSIELTYIRLGYKTGNELNLKLIKTRVNIEELEEEEREYLYLAYYNHRLTNPVAYHFMEGLMIEDFKKKTFYSSTSYQLLYIYFDKWFKEEEEILYRFFSSKDFIQLFEDDFGKRIVDKLIDRVVNTKGESEYTGYLQNLIKVVGYENIVKLSDYVKVLKLYEDIDQVENVFHMDYEISLFLKNKDYLRFIHNNNPLKQLLVGMLSDDFIIPLFAQYKKISDDISDEVKEQWFYFVSQRVVLNHEYITKDLIEEMIKFNDKHLRVWLELGIKHGVARLNRDEQKYFTELSGKHGIMFTTKADDFDRSNLEEIKYLSKPSAKPVICYRYEEDQSFYRRNMEHIAFGIFIFPIKLYPDEAFQYYIIVDDENGNEVISVSEIIYHDRDGLETDGNLVDDRLIAIDIAQKINDESSEKELIKEQIEFEKKVKKIPRVW